MDVKRICKLFISLYAALAMTGMLQSDGSFCAAHAWVGAVGLVLLGWELYIEFVPFRSNRTYYRLAIARMEE